MNIDLNQLKKFSNTYLSILKNELSGLNLTRILDEEEFFQKQIIDSVQFLSQNSQFLEFLNNQSMIFDLGFGGGFPILPLAYLFPDNQFIGIESRLKKVEAVSFISKKLNIKNIRLIHSRFEDIYFDLDGTIVSKAVSTVEKMTDMLEDSCRINQLIYFYKTEHYNRKESQNNHKNWKEIERLSYTISDNMNRIFIGFKKISVPRGTKSKNKIKLSSLI